LSKLIVALLVTQFAATIGRDVSVRNIFASVLTVATVAGFHLSSETDK
jgi:hypothetical protein